VALRDSWADVIAVRGRVVEADKGISINCERPEHVELEAINAVLPIHKAQLLSYPKLLNIMLGLFQFPCGQAR
jgi:hypothetical protein